MKKNMSIFLLIILVAALLFGAWLFTRKTPTANDTSTPQNTSLTHTAMQLSSTAFRHNSDIPSGYTCDGENISPPFQITGVPKNAQNLALIVHDPDAPAGDWVHWLLWNIDPETKEIGAGIVPRGAVSGTTDFGKTGYGGPCPPSGTHRYFHELYALDTKLNLPEGARLPALRKAMNGHVLAKTELIGLYKRGQ